MQISDPLIKGIIHKRYKRFLADVELEDGQIVTVHVPNTGPMTSCWEKNWPVLISKSSNKKRKLPFTLEWTHSGESWIGVNTHRANRIVEEALLANQIAPFKDYGNIKAEEKYEDGRIDFFLSEHNEKPDCFIEVKNVTLKSLDCADLALFPDTVTTRGLKHLKLLERIVTEDKRAAMIYLVNREDVTKFSPAAQIDPNYANALTQAHKCGVEVYAYQVKITPPQCRIVKELPVLL